MDSLTEREYEVLMYVVRGYSNAQISEITCITEHTVKAHITSIMKKLNVKSRTEATYVAFKNHVIKDEDF